MTAVLKETKADTEIRKCLDENRCFHVIAGAGSGKTTSLVTALDYLRKTYGMRLKRDAQHIVCVTYTKRAVEVISSRLGWDSLFIVSTLHGFLWEEVKRYTPDIRRALQESVIPLHIAKKREDDDGGKSKKALAAREKVLTLEHHLANLKHVSAFKYGDSNYSDYATGDLGHDDVIDVAACMILTNERLRRIIGQKYPYIFVDEAQDTQENVVAALNKLCENPGLPVVGYFGDPKQQIYDKRAGEFKGPPESLRIPKEENFRCSNAVINLLNAFRKDIQQFAAGKNADAQGSVILRLVQTEKGGAPRGRYTPEQTEWASQKLDEALTQWDWAAKSDVKHLYLVRQMIARRLNFYNLHALFTGKYASQRAQDEYENGEHFILKPFVDCLYPLLHASRTKDQRATINILRQNSPAFDPNGTNAHRSLADIIKLMGSLLGELNKKWESANVGDVLRFCQKNELCSISKRLSESLDRATRSEAYDEEIHAEDKGEWLADECFGMNLIEIEHFCDFIAEKTPFSTQHGVKGEQYESVLVVFDDVGSAWNNYSFSKTLAPSTFGEPTDRQLRLSENLAYVCFSRAERDLRIVMYTTNAVAARLELLDRKLLASEQIEVAN